MANAAMIQGCCWLVNTVADRLRLSNPINLCVCMPCFPPSPVCYYTDLVDCSEATVGPGMLDSSRPPGIDSTSVSPP